MTSVESLNLHATALIFGEHGLLLRGPAGAGKSILALDLIVAAKANGKFSCLVGDDRILLDVRQGRLIATAHPAIKGLIELRNFGIQSHFHEENCVIHALIDLDGKPERLPEPGKRVIELLGIKLYHLILNQRGLSSSHSFHAIRALLESAVL